MHFKLIMVLAKDEETKLILETAREAGATGSTVITSARGEGLNPEKTFLGLELTSGRDLLLFLVAAPRAREILETIAAAGQFDDKPGSGIAVQIQIEDAVGMKSQTPALLEEIEDQL